MAIVKVRIELCSGGEITDAMRVMVEIAERYRCDVEADLNGTPITVGPDRVAEVFELWQLKRKQQ